MKKKILISFLLYIFTSKSFAQLDEIQIKVSLVYQSCQNIQWENEANFKNFTIAIFGVDRNIENEFRKLSKTVKLKNKNIKIIKLNNINEIEQNKPHVIYVTFEKLIKLNSIYKEIQKFKSILLFTENSHNKEKIMINLINNINKVNFEINTKTIKEQNLSIRSGLTLMGGKELDLKKLYLDKEKELKDEKIKSKQLLDSIKQQENKIRLQKSKIKKQNDSIFLQKNRIVNQKLKLNRQSEGIKEQETLLLNQKNDILKQQNNLLFLSDEINNQKELVSNKNIIITKKQNYIKSQITEVEDKQKILTELNDKIKNQKQHLQVKNEMIENQKQGLIWAYGFILTVFVLIIFILRAYKINKKNHNRLKEKSQIINNKNDELQTLTEELSFNAKELDNQNIELSKKNKNITHSINYASHIQNAMLPQFDIFADSFSEYFILFKPRDVVSGDFYWSKKKGNSIILVIADCTGHGVPGALVSILGISILNEITSKDKVLTPDKILNEMRVLLKRALKQDVANSKSKDGIDISLSIIDLKTRKLQFAGAYNHLYIVRNKEKIKIKADRQPIGIGLKETNFKNQEFQLKKNDIIYSYSDGYADQLGGDNFRKFLSLKFINLLVDISEQPFNDQKDLLEKTLSNWKGKRPQTDDILVFAGKVK